MGSYLRLILGKIVTCARRVPETPGAKTKFCCLVFLLGMVFFKNRALTSKEHDH